MTLRWKILLYAGLHLFLTAAALALFTQVQFHTGAESILLSPAQGRLQSMGEEIGWQLEEKPQAEWTALLRRYEQQHGLQLGLYLNGQRWLAGSLDALPEALEAHLRAPRHPIFFERTSGPTAYWFGVRLGARPEGADHALPCTLVVRSDSFLLNPLLFDPWPWMIWGLAFLGITLLCWIPFIRGLTTSVHKLTAAAEQIATGNFQVKLSTRGADEIAGLGQALSRMAAQLNGFVNGQKRFLGDIAHELSAPVSRTQVALSILEERAEPAVQKYVASLREEVDQMSTLVNELLHFSRVSLTAKPETLATVPVGEVVREVIAREGAEAAVQLVEGGDLAVKAQRHGLARALANVVRNAVHYAGAEGPIEIRARRDGSHVLITVSDCGPGMPEDSLDRVFQPFYRLDASRTRTSGGVGLGLAIVKQSIEASGGVVHCRNRSPRGLEVVMRLNPAAI